MKTSHTLLATVIAATAILSGCAAPMQQTSTPVYQAQTQAPVYANSQANAYGVVEAIHMKPAAAGGIGVGAVVGGVVGGLLGNQVGGGSGKKVATVAGVAGGAVVGHQIQQNNRAQTPDMYQISVRLDNRTYQTYEQDSIGDLRVGSRARIESGRVYRY